jgi:cytochrome c oxidase subunit 1
MNSITYLNPEFILVLGFLSMFIVGGLSGSFCAHAGTDILLHDTYYIVGHFHVMLSGALMAMLFAFIYFNMRELAGINYPKILAFLHGISHNIGHIVTFLPMLWLG